MDRLGQLFSNHFGGSPSIRVIAPGRVNLIGEHTDYNGLPVFPMAIQRRIYMAIRPHPGRTVRAVNADSRYPVREFEVSDAIEPGDPGDWGNYLKAAAQKLAALHGPLSGFDAVVDGDVPPSAGLSSSSALVVASALALMAANHIPLEREALMPLLADAEHYVGTRGGGMDQAISLGGQRGMAVKIDFDPLSLTHAPVPTDWQFIIAHSLVTAEKSGRVREQYNARPRECREALVWMSRRLGIAGARDYRALVNRFSPEELTEAAQGLDSPLRQRFLHVIWENHRVERALEAMRHSDGAGFGALMNSSHASLRDEFAVSCPALDTLVAAAVESGAWGARLTGAGFGGCAILLVSRGQAPALTERLEARFYHSRPERTSFPDYLLPAEPSDGASIENL